jgi:hypothetical protein
MAAIESGSSASGLANVTSTYDLQVRDPITLTAIGMSGLAGLLDDGANRVDSAGVPYAKRVMVSESGRVAVGQDMWAFTDTFSAAALSSANWKTPATTQTVATSGGFVLLNSGAATAINQNSAIQTWRTFAIPTSGEIRCETFARLNTLQINQVVEFGLLSATLPGAAAPADGVFFRYNASNELRGLINFNGTETQTATITAPTAGNFAKYKIVLNERSAEFWVNDTLRAEIDIATAAPSQAMTFISGALPYTARYIIGASSPALGTNFAIAKVNIWYLDGQTAMPLGHQMSGMGWSAYQGQNGSTMGTSANYANSANPTAAVPTNTTAALGSGLGGQFWETDSLAVTTDGIISSFQNPAGTTTVPGKALYITGVRIDSHVQAVLTGGGYVASWSLAFGHTAVSIATAESLTVPTKAARRVALGFQTVAAAAAALTLLAPITVRFDGCPIVVNPGEFIATVKKKIGTAPTVGTIAHLITFDGYYA